MHPGLVHAALCLHGTARDGNGLLEPAWASPLEAPCHLMDIPFKDSLYIILYTWVKHTHDLWQHRLAGTLPEVRALAALPRRALLAWPAAIHPYIPKPHACAEAG